MRIADLIEKHADELAGIESLDNGKPLVMSKIADIPLSADHFRYYGGWADKLHGKVRGSAKQGGVGRVGSKDRDMDGRAALPLD